MTRPSTPPTAIDSSTAGSSDTSATSAFAVSTEQTMIAPPTETSIPPVMMMIVMPMPIRAIGAVATSSGRIEPAVRKAGVARARPTQITAMTPIRTSSWPVTGDGRMRLRASDGACGSPEGGEVRVAVIASPPAVSVSVCSAPAAAASTSTWVASGPNSTVVVPPRTTCRRSEMRSASGRSEVTTSTAVPFSASSVMIRWISSLAPTSTPCVGSASTSTSGRSTSWRASTTFCAFPPDMALIGCRSCGVRTASRLIMSRATVRSRARSTKVPKRDSSFRCPAEMLNAIDWKPNIPSSLRFAGSSAMPSFCASPRRPRARSSCRRAASRRSSRGRSRRCRRRSPRRRSPRARRGRRSRPGGPPRSTSWNLPGATERVEHERRRAVGDLAVRPLVGQDPADHELGDLAHRQLADRVRADRLPVAHDGDLVGDAEQLVEPVGDVDDGDARRGQPADDREQHLDLGVGQDRRRLVQDEHGRLAGQRLGDRHLLLLGDRERADRHRGVAGGQAEQLEQLDDLGVLLGPGDPAAPADLPAGEDVLRDRELGEQLRLLVHGRDAQGHGVAGRADRDRPALELDRAGVGGLDARR